MTCDALLFAAGMGTRMSPLSDHCPKALIEVAGKLLIEHALAQLDFPIIGKRVVNVHRHADRLEDWARAAGLAISDERDLLRDTGGGLRHALPQMNGSPVIAMNTDAVWTGGSPVPRLIDGWTDDMGARLVVVPVARVIGRPGGRKFDIMPDGRLTGGTRYAYTGLQAINPDRLPHVDADAFSMWEYWTPFMAENRLYAEVHEGFWADVGEPASIPLAERMLADAV